MNSSSTPSFDFLIVGAGLFGATAARLLTDKGYRCLVIDKRQHSGGNVYCENIEGINVHKYGAHIFHTSNKTVWDFVNSFVPFNRYTNCPVAVAPDGGLYNLPFNMNTFHALWGVTTPDQAAKVLDEQRRDALEALRADGAEAPRNLEEQALCLVGRDIYRLLIKEYTEKQWGRRCQDLPAFIIKRLPVRMVYDNNYFNDLYQGIPVGGYNRLIDGLLDGVEVRLGVDFFDDRAHWEGIAERMVFTGKIDQFFDYRFGKLQYRSVRFETEVLDTPNHQGNAVVNYTSAAVPYTRVIEHKHFESFGDEVYRNPRTVISREFSTEWNESVEPYYPINDDTNSALYARYKALADETPHVIFGGRLAQYRYYDMAPVIEAAFAACKSI